MVEDSEPLDDGQRVRVLRRVEAGANRRAAGSDIQRGQRVFEAFTELRPAHLGVLASLGFRRVPVYPSARVGVLSTGDELVDDGSPLQPGQIRESNRVMLLGLLAQAGCAPTDLGTVRDDEARLTAAIDEAVATCDALITSGGVSMGDFDLVKVVLDRMGDMRWMQIAIRPAKPFAFGLLGDGMRAVPVFGLPGNPVSSLVSFELLARPALRTMMAHQVVDRPSILAVADEPMTRSADGKTHFVRVRGDWHPDGRFHVRSTGAQGSHQLASTASANALAVLPDGTGVAEGDGVRVLLMA
jgi:molybdenum cofactor synthesis domain-containing protein